VNGFIDHLHTPLRSTSNYSAIANLHTLQITIAPAKHFSSLLCFHLPFPGNGFDRRESASSQVQVLPLCRNQLSTDRYQLNYSTVSSQPPLQSSTERVRARVRVSLRLSVYRQSVRLCDKPLQTHEHPNGLFPSGSPTSLLQWSAYSIIPKCEIKKIHI
jgi:hypothetical protein